jgi:hypothetical protein
MELFLNCGSAFVLGPAAIPQESLTIFFRARGPLKPGPEE